MGRRAILGLVTLSLFVVSGCTAAGPTVTPTSSPAPRPTAAASPTPALTPRPTPSPAPTSAPLPTVTSVPTPPPSPPMGTPPATPTAVPPPSPTPAATPAPSPTPASVTVEVQVVAQGLEVPWELAFAPDGRLFFTERPGRLRVMVDGRLLAEPVATFSVAATGEAGLLGLALDPDFESNHFVYVYYTYREGGRLLNRVVRLVESDSRASDAVTLIDGIPGGNIHDGGRLKFGPDGKLYITTGDAGQSGLAQDLASLAGKVLRINNDGSIPQDNPFSGSPVYSLGHRNPQGLAWHPGSGRLYSTEHGPSGRDEVNIIEPGRNYGWPTASGVAGKVDFVDPIAEYTPSIAPSGAAFYTGQAVPQWQGDLFFATLRGAHLHRMRLDGDGRVLAEERLYQGAYGRLRSVVQGPDGLLYFATNNRDGRGNPVATDDRILRLGPAGR